jgi:hypothetical protein
MGPRQARLSQEQDVIHLQRRIGNKADQKSFRIDAEERAAASTRFGHDFSLVPLRPAVTGKIQPKLKVSTQGDPLEREADRVADQVTGMSVSQQQQISESGGACQNLDRTQEPDPIHSKYTRTTESGQMAAPSIVSEVLNQPGQPLDTSTRGFMEPRLGRDLSGVRVHSDSKAAVSATAVRSLAFTVGNDIVFGEGQYAPGTREGRWLLAHELAHTVQQTQGGQQVQRISFDDCTAAQQTTVTDAHSRAIEMLDNAIAKLGIYDGTTPANVKTSLNTHFHSSSSGFAGWVRFNLRYLSLFVDLPQYECHSVQSIPNPAWTMWCVPFTDIELYPNWFSFSRDYRASLMIHEWVHHYGCNFDLGYVSSPGYSGHGTIRSLLNAEPWQYLCYEIR